MRIRRVLGTLIISSIIVLAAGCSIGFAEQETGVSVSLQNWRMPNGEPEPSEDPVLRFELFAAGDLTTEQLDDNLLGYRRRGSTVPMQGQSSLDIPVAGPEDGAAIERIPIGRDYRLLVRIMDDNESLELGGVSDPFTVRGGERSEITVTIQPLENMAPQPRPAFPEPMQVITKGSIGEPPDSWVENFEISGNFLSNWLGITAGRGATGSAPADLFALESGGQIQIDADIDSDGNLVVFVDDSGSITAEVYANPPEVDSEPAENSAGNFIDYTSIHADPVRPEIIAMINSGQSARKFNSQDYSDFVEIDVAEIIEIYADAEYPSYVYETVFAADVFDGNLQVIALFNMDGLDQFVHMTMDVSPADDSDMEITSSTQLVLAPDWAVRDIAIIEDFPVVVAGEGVESFAGEYGVYAIEPDGNLTTIAQDFHDGIVADIISISFAKGYASFGEKIIILEEFNSNLDSYFYYFYRITEQGIELLWAEEAYFGGA
ncbi:hypothetical protein [Spirochaeta africana]|uniref:Uncharacterized protein n=1 Tax=Spirochaeta africana (strain ATCC 700263 / DSM 8902 / Z-7692) TaxID=889378 RepID=H9UK01_SPIAZ|nr:hypothetical protein [Spirochaeta africana]AFG37844.1 hypothetical protein Spiaf_1787 [Spirochaeta africana DSM 8902]